MNFVSNIKTLISIRLRMTSQIRTNKLLRNALGAGIVLLIYSVSTGHVFSEYAYVYIWPTLISIPSEPPAAGEVVVLPHVETFDQYPIDFSFESSINGWEWQLEDESSVIAVSSLPVVPPPSLNFSNHCLRLDTAGKTLSLAATDQADNVWIDMALLMRDTDILPQDFPSSSQLGLQLLGHFEEGNIKPTYRHLIVASGITNEWIVGPQLLSPDDWLPLQMTIQLACADNLTRPYFRIFLNQTNVIWSSGFSLPDIPSEEGGAWLPCITTTRTFHGVSFSGNGYIDDIRMSNSNLGPITPVQANFGQAVAISWPSDYGQSYQVETCVDLVDDAWEAFGGPVIGNGATNTVFEKTGSSTRKFYRVIPLR